MKLTKKLKRKKGKYYKIILIFFWIYSPIIHIPLKEQEYNLEQDLLKFISEASKNNNTNINNKQSNLIKKQFSFNENKNNNYNNNQKKSKAQTPQKIIDKLKKAESELKRNISKLVQKEKNIKEESYMDLNRIENSRNINPALNKEIFELKQISENKEIYSSQLNEIKFRINSLREKYNNKNGINNNNYKGDESMYIFKSV